MNRGVVRHPIGWLLLVALLGAGCGQDDKSTRPGGGSTAAELTEQGWAAFTEGRYDDALDSFDQAIAKDAGHGPAYVGAGWAKLESAQSDQDLRGAVGSFGTAAVLGQTGADAIGGRAAARLALGAGELSGAAADAAFALNAAPAFVFEHRPSFDADDLHLIVAFAQAACARYAEALAAADLVAPSGIDPTNPGSWRVGGETYATFALAVLAHLAALSDSECSE